MLPCASTLLRALNRPLVRSLILANLAILILSSVNPLAAQSTTSTGTATGARQSQSAREAMWPAPSAEDWAKPCLITFQRTYEDAQAVSQETGKPILVCVNMDGEIASEHYAGIRYRQPETAALYEPYVNVIASVYRHNDRDYDELGRRILCPRFGSVTCGEHIAIEPGLYEKFLDGQRIAPRHIGVERDGQELYDVFYAFDTDSVFEAIRQGIAQREFPDVPPPPGDRSLAERALSAEISDREALEGMWLDGSGSTRLQLMQAARQAGSRAPVDLLRLALHAHDPELRRMAREALALSESPKAVDLLVDVLSDPLLGDTEHAALLAALERLGQGSVRARRLAVVHRGLAGRSGSVDMPRWLTAVESDAPAPLAFDREQFQTPLERQDEILSGNDPAAHLDLAEALLQFAYEQHAFDPPYANLLFMDAQSTAQRARSLGAYGWRLEGALSISAFYLGDTGEAQARAIDAVQSGLPDNARDWNTMAVLANFAGARQEAIRIALRAGEEWPPEWVTDVHAACLVLLRHPYGTEEQAVAYHDFLQSLGARGEASQILDEGLDRYADSWDLHDRLRRRVFSTIGFEQLEPTYAQRLARSDAPPGLHYFAGYASLVTAEFLRRTGRPADEALAAYERAMMHFETDIRALPEARDDSDHFIALALGGAARVSLEAGHDQQAVAALLASFERRPASAATLDGLNLSAVDTAKMLKSRLADLGQEDLHRQVSTALERLPAKLLELPAYERGPPEDDPTRPSWRRRWQRSGPGQASGRSQG